MKIKISIIIFFILNLLLFSCAQKTPTDTVSNIIHKNFSDNFSLKIPDGYKAVPETRKYEVIGKIFPSSPQRSSVFLNDKKKTAILLYRMTQMILETDSRKNKVLNDFEGSISESVSKIDTVRGRNSLKITFTFRDSTKTIGLANLSLIPDLWTPNKYSLIVSFVLTEKKYFESVKSEFEGMLGSLRNI